MAQRRNTVYCFGDFRLAPAECLLLHKDKSLTLTPKAFDALLLLVENAGYLVEKGEFMRRLWPETFVGDDTLAQNISLLRKALHDGMDGAEWIITVPRRGYRFAGTVRELIEAPATPNLTQERTVTPQLPAKDPTKESAALTPTLDRKPGSILLSRLRLIGAAVATGALAATLTYAYFAPPAHLSVTGAKKITRSGRVDPVRKMVTDGSRIYFLEREGDHWNVAQTSLSGGETQVVRAPFPNTTLLDLSPDQSEFLISSFSAEGKEMPLWTWPVQGGAPTRVGELTVHDAAWHPNGRQVVVSRKDGVYIADRDGSHVTKLAATDSSPSNFSWSPDGAVVRFSIFPPGIESSSIWEVRADGTGLHQLLAGWSNPAVECCGSFSPDQRYYFFASSHLKSSDLWSMQEESGFFNKRESKPLRLTFGPTSFSNPLVIGTKPKRLFTFGYDYKIELAKYDPKAQKSSALIPGSHGEFPNFSRDGKWIAYAKDNVLWRARSDGSEPLRISESPVVPTHPAWSPDGKQIAFVNHTTYCENKLYVVSAEGGTARELFPNDCEQFDPSWSPDGRFLSFARSERLASGKESPCTIELLDVAANKLTTIEASEGLRAPAWSPDGRWLAAISEDYHKLMLYDVPAKKWMELSQGASISGFLRWSRDGAYLYYQDLLAPNEAVYRIRLRDRKREEVANFEELIKSGVQRCAFTELTPDGSLVMTLLQSHADIYALDLDWP